MYVITLQASKTNENYYSLLLFLDELLINPPYILSLT